MEIEFYFEGEDERQRWQFTDVEDVLVWALEERSLHQIVEIEGDERISSILVYDSYASEEPRVEQFGTLEAAAYWALNERDIPTIEKVEVLQLTQRDFFEVLNGQYTE